MPDTMKSDPGHVHNGITDGCTHVITSQRDSVLSTGHF